MDVRDFYVAEALVCGGFYIACELIICFQLWGRGRLLYHYHALPIATGVALLLSGWFDADLALSALATHLSIATSLNLYNTYYVSVVASGQYVVPPASVQTALDDLFLPRYTAAFYPFGPVVQVAYSLLVLAHCVVRVYATYGLLSYAPGGLRG